MRKLKQTLAAVLILLALYALSLYNYLLFHTTAEFLSIIVSFVIFSIAWNLRKTLESHYLLLLGIALIHVSVIDMAHALSYKGMNIFAGYDANLPTQLWIAARYLHATSLLIAPFFISRRLNPARISIIYLLSTALLLSSALAGIFPDCFIEGKGLTRFKIYSEYVISAMLATSFYALYRKRAILEPHIFKLIAASVALTIASEISFTFYISVYGLSNLIGHYFKIVAYYFLYNALVKIALMRPMDLLYKEVKSNELRLGFALDELKNQSAITSALLNASHAVLKHEDFPSAARAIFDNCKAITGATSGYVALLSKDGTENEVLFLDAGGLPCTVDPSLPMPIRGLRSVAYETGITVYENNFMNSRWADFMPSGHVALKNAMFAPLILEGKTVGILGLANKNDMFTETDADIASSFGDLAVVALKNTRYIELIEAERDKARKYLEIAGTIFLAIDKNQNAILINKKGCDVLGRTEQEIIGKNWFDNFVPQSTRDEMKKILGKMMAGEYGLAEYYENPIIRHDGMERLIAWHNTYIKDSEGNIAAILSSGEDITESKAFEERQRQSLMEKDMLIKEIHHRVKNNLAVITSLLNLQSRQIKDAEAKELFTVSQNRVKSMSMIHERLYRSPDMTSINFGEYLRSMAKQLLSTYGINPAQIKLSLIVPEAALDIDTVIPVGLILNELITNSLKHAFPDGRTGELMVMLQSEEGGLYELTVKDNGKGIPEGITGDNSETLGLQLVYSLTKQINGSISLLRDGGTEFRISFKDKRFI